jgi:L-amino acid N-acyltransferase YncA
MTDDALRDLVAQLRQLLEQAADDSAPVLPRITTAVAAHGYLDALTRQLVTEAREKGHSWEELAVVFATSPANVQYRFGSIRQYDDD